MTAIPCLLALLLTAPAAEVATLDGRTLSGDVTALDSTTLELDVAGGTAIPLSDVLEVRFPQDATLPVAPTDFMIWFADGSQFGASQVTAQNRMVTATLPEAGPITVPQKAVQAVRLKPADPAVDARWAELVAAPAGRDLLVLRNGDLLDRVEGTASTLDEATLTFLVGETAIPIRRDKPKLFGVIYAKPAETPPRPAVSVRLHSGDRLGARTVTLSEQGFAIALSAGAVLKLPVAAVQVVDYGQGKVAYLSATPPRDSRFEDFFGDAEPPFTVYYDRNARGQPIKIARRTYGRGIVMHSKAILTWRLGGDYRRLVAVAGIEDTVRNSVPDAEVLLTIAADGKPPWSRQIRSSDPPLPIDYDVTDARTLTITVDYGFPLQTAVDVGDHLALGDARLIK